MRIWLDPTRLAAYGLTAQDVENALRQQNVEVPAGRIESQMREFTVLSQTDLQTPEQFNNIVLRESQGYLVRLRDVGKAEIAAEDERRVTRFNDKTRSEEHTSELQSLMRISYAVFCLKKKKI